MALNKHFNVDTYKFEDRPKPKLWLLKPNGQRIERIAGVSKLQGTFKYTNLNQITFQISPTMFDGIQHQQVKNTVFDKIRNKYIIELKYNNFRDYFVIDDLKEVSDDSENIQVVADSLGSELNGKPMSEIEMLGSTIEEMYEKVFENYSPLWKLEFVDSKVKEVKRELTAQQGTVMSASEQINTLFDTITIFDNINRKISVYHKDSVGINRGLRVRENSYLKSFEDSMVSKDIITRLIPIGSNGLTIHSANPAGSDYIEDFSFFIKPFKRDANRNVLEHSDYMSDDLCHALLDYDEFYNSKKEEIDEFTKRYSEILKQHSEEDFKLKSLNAIVERQEDRIELLKPKSEYIDLGVKTKNFNITVAKSSYYILMLKNEGTLVNIKFDGKTHQLKSGEWTYIKIDTSDFEDATKVDEKLQYKIEMLSATTRVHAVITRSSKDDYDEEDTKKIEEKYNYLKYSQLRDEQQALVSSIERRMKQFEEEKADLVASMNPKLFLSEELYKEREQFVYGAIWQEENHTDAKELYDDAEKQLKKKNNVTRSLNVGIVNFIQSLEHKEDWDKLNVGDKIVFSNKFFNKKLKAYITEMQIGFDENSINLTLSDVFDYKDDMQRVSELIANTSSTSNQVNMQKEQIKDSQGKITKMTELIEGEWDANKKRVLAGNETVDIGSHGVKVISNEDPNEFVIMVGGVIAMTKDGGETFKTGVTPEGVNAEMLIGKMIIGEDLWLENESGTMRFNKDGFHIDASLFHLTTNEGKEDYFSKLKNEIQEENKQLETRIKDEYTRKINNAIQESLDVENMIDNVSNVLKDTFSDGIITDVEKKLINDTLSSLEKENAENVQQIEMALNHPYVTNDDIVELDQAYTIYDGMYEALVQSIHECIADNIITSDESIRVNEAVVQFRDEVKDIMVLVKQILETTRDNQLNQKIEESLDYTTRLNNDLKDEMNDLNKAFETTKETIDKALEDGIFDAAEIEAIKTALMIMKSEQQDILNRYEQIVANEKLPADARARIVKSHNEYVAAFKDFNDYVLEMISDGVSNDTERENYQSKFDILTQKNSVFTQDYTYALQAIALQYTQDAEGKLQEQYDGLKMEIAADLKDVRDNMTELENIFDDAFKDGIVTEAEVTRLQVHLDMLDREYLDVDERYKTLVNDTRIEQSIRTELASKRSAYASSHSNLRVIITQVIEDRKVTAEEKTQVNNALSTYNTSFAAFSKVIQIAMNNLSQNLANSAAENKKQEMIDELNKYKETVSNDFTELNGKVDNFEETIWDSFEDQIIETSEAAAINQYINILANEKGRIEKQYTVIVNNKDLVGSPKTQLSNSYGALISSYDALIETIQSAIADNKIIETERTAVNQKFADYKVKLSDYEDKINKAIDAIIKNVATSEANKVNERFETWKSSEFVVESDKIAQRVSGTNWEETYLPTLNDKIDNIQIGGRNLLAKSTQQFLDPKLSYSSGIVEIDGKKANLFNTSNNIIYLNGSNYTFEEGEKYTFSFYAKATKPIGMTQGIYLNSQNRGFLKDTIFTTEWTRYSFTFIAVGNNKVGIHMYPIIKNNDETYESFYITDWQLEKGNKVTDCTPSLEDTQSQIDATNNKVNNYATKIEANNSFIEQNKDRITSSVSKSEVDATLSKIATYETSYQIKNKAQKTLLEYNGIAFNDNYSYEVVAKARYDGYDTLAVATFISKGKGFELTILDEKGTTGAHPLFELVNNKPSISVYSNMVTEYTIDVIYTKYLGSASTIERTNSQIKQLSDNITLQVDKLHEELDTTNILVNSEFSNNAETWTTSYNPDNFTIPDKSEMSINSDNNLILNGLAREDIFGASHARRIMFTLTKPLVPNQSYTVAFNCETISEITEVTVLPYTPHGGVNNVKLVNGDRTVLTFQPTSASTELYIYVGIANEANQTNDFKLSNVTLIEGDKPLPFRYGSSKNVAKMTYKNNINYPSIVSDYISVGKSGELSVGDTITCSTYVYIPSSSKGKLTENIYFSISCYENNKQGSSPNSGILNITPDNFVYDTWVRYSFTATIPASTSNGKTNYLRLLLRYAGSNQDINTSAIFYYGMPQLEVGYSATRWTPAKIDGISTEGMASKIALNPESIDIISENLNINTDVLTIKNTKGNFTMAGDTLTISDTSGNNQTKITSNGISIKADGVNKMLNGLDMAEWEVRPYEPQFSTWNALPPTHSAAGAKYNNMQIVQAGRNGLYAVEWGQYNFGKQYKQLIENNNTAYARVNRYTYVYNKRYLKITFSSVTSKGVSLILRAMDSTGGIQMAYQKIVDTSYTYPVFIIDLQKSLGYKADNKVHYFELQAGLTANSGVANADHGSFRITRMSMTDFNE